MNHLQTEQQLIDAIRAASRIHSGQVMAAIFKTFAVPTVVFVVLVVLGNVIRDYVSLTFNSSALNLSTFASTVLATIALAWWALRWAEQRFGGLALMRGLFRVTRLTLEVERAQERGDTAAASQLADEAWATYQASMGAVGVYVPNP